MNDTSASAKLAKKVVSKMLELDLFSRWLGIELLEAAPGRAKIKMKIRAEMLNGFKVCHGGITFAFADSAFAFAANTQGKISVSIRNDIAYPKAVVEGDELVAEASESSAGDKIANYDVLVTNQRSEKVALFRGTVYRTSREYLANE